MYQSFDSLINTFLPLSYHCFLYGGDLGLRLFLTNTLPLGVRICYFLCSLMWLVMAACSYFLQILLPPAQMSNLGELSYQPIKSNTHNLVTLDFLTHLIFLLCTSYPQTYIKKLVFKFVYCLSLLVK